MSQEILIVEDSEAKLDSIRTLLSRDFPLATLRYAFSVSSAIAQLKQRIPAVVVADMSLPTYDIEKRERGGTPRPFGGIEVFEYLDRFDVVAPVVVVTSYPALSDGENTMDLSELTARLKDEFPDNFLGTVYFDSAYSSWERELTALIHSVLKENHGS